MSTAELVGELLRVGAHVEGILDVPDGGAEVPIVKVGRRPVSEGHAEVLGGRGCPHDRLRVQTESISEGI